MQYIILLLAGDLAVDLPSLSLGESAVMLYTCAATVVMQPAVQACGCHNLCILDRLGIESATSLQCRCNYTGGSEQFGLCMQSGAQAGSWRRCCWSFQALQHVP